MERTHHEDECRYCEQDRHGGWIYCRSCGRLLSRTEVITVRAAASGDTSQARAQR
jgi:methionyl-tRNA synthetase